MSANDFGNILAVEPPPQHHKHESSDVLPGTQGGPPTADYTAHLVSSPEVHKINERRFGAGTDTGAVMAGGPHRASDSMHDQHNANYSAGGQHDAAHEDRPMNVQPTDAGGVAVDGRNDLPEGHANMTDKLAGKTQKVFGKLMKNAEMHEKGELRESGGKEAAAGRARAPHH